MKKFVFLLISIILPVSVLQANGQAGFLNSPNNGYQIFLLGYFMLMIITMFKGYGENRTVIIFRDYDDLGLTFLVPASFILIIYLFRSLGGDQQLASLLAIGVSIVLFTILVRNTYLDNHRSLLPTVLALMTKIPLGIIWVLNLVTVLNPSGKTASERRKNRGSALVILALLTPLITLLVVNKKGSLFNPKEWIRGRNVGSITNHL